MIFELAYLLGLVPAVWLAGLRLRGRPIGAAWWWLAGAFFVSFVADSVARFLPPDQRFLVSLVYPITQAALVAAVLLDRLEAMQFTAALVIAGVVSILWHGVAGPDVLLRTVAWGSVAAFVWERRALGRVRGALLVTFGIGLVAWWGYAVWPGWTSYLLYQSTRALGTALFCIAASNPTPKFRLARRER